MKTVKWLLIAAVVMGGLGVAVAYKSRLQKPTPEAPAPAEQPVTQPEPAPAPVAQALAAARTAAAVQPNPVEPPPDEPRLPMVDWAPGKPLAIVNGVAILPGDLMAISADAASVSLRSDAFQELLKRAVERELTFQTARARGVVLQPEQQADVERVRAEALARAGAPYTLPGYNAEAQAAFEAREREAQLLLNLLLGETGSPAAPATDEQIQQYYAAHAGEFSPLPRKAEAREQAWLLVESDIRAKLAAAAQSHNDEKRQRLFAELESQANVEYLIAPGNP